MQFRKLMAAMLAAVQVAGLGLVSATYAGEMQETAVGFAGSEYDVIPTLDEEDTVEFQGDCFPQGGTRITTDILQMEMMSEDFQETNPKSVVNVTPEQIQAAVPQWIG